MKSAHLEAPSSQTQKVLNPLSRKLHYYFSAVVFLSVCSVLLGIIVIQLQEPSSSGGTIPQLLPQSTSQIILYSLAWGVIVSCLASLGIFFLSRKITAPLTLLSRVTEKINHGEFYSQAILDSEDEIGLLKNAITEMSTQLHELKQDNKDCTEQFDGRTKSAKLMHDRLETIFKTSLYGFWRVDNDLITQEINQRMVKMLGGQTSDFIGKTITDFMGTPNRTTFHKQIHLGKNLLSTEYEVELKQLDGTFIPCLFNATPLLDENGNKHGSFIMVTEISTLKKTEKELLKAKSLAEHASHVKSSFLANMSHEIRTPLNGIIGSLELLDKKNLDASKQKQFMETARKSADYLLMLLNDILDLSKIEADKIESEQVAFLPGTLMDQLQSMFITQAKNKGIELHCSVHKSVPDVLVGDEVRLTQISINLLSNAVKFTQEGSVSISLLCTNIADGHVSLQCRVTDTGIGLTPEKQEIIFDSFSQADASITREFGGTGLGLSLCRKLCSLMGGDIGVESIKGEGSTFYFNIPFEIGDRSQLATHEVNDPGMQLAEAKMQPLDILVVDDNNINLDVAVMFLSQNGHRVKTAFNGLQALKTLSVYTFDCIFMDIQMPKMDGVTATRFLRACEQKTVPPKSLFKKPLLKQLHAKVRGTHTPIVALTANVFQSDREKYIKAGMDDHLGKPIRGKDMYLALDRVIKNIKYEDFAMSKKLAPVKKQKDSGVTEKMDLSIIREHLKEMYSFAPSQIDSIIETSSTTLKEVVKALDKACLDNNKKEIDEAAHKLKGSLANLGMGQQAEMAKKMEFSAKANEEQPYSEWFTSLRNNLKPLLRR
ncbi:MAG: hypothetical protein DSY80_02400 [Desulfocapsa sp.]|nr:MAG: hypothetical protein DSY80_02400 [Desulfocapsa sp.]